MTLSIHRQLLRLGAVTSLGCAALSASAEPEPAKPSITQEQPLPTERMLGPLPLLSDHCDALSKEGIGLCDAVPTEFGRGWQRGARGPLLGATTLSVSRKLGPHAVKTCHVALRTARGWYLSAQTATCEGPSVGEELRGSLSSLRWADEAGFGVLSVVVSQDRLVQPVEHRWWGQLALESNTFESQVMLCGLGVDQTPRCSAFLTTQCGNSWSPILTWDNGLLHSTSNPGMQRLCAGLVLPAGAYSLPFVPGRLPFHEQPPSEDSSEPAPSGPQRLYGPFASVDAYCADLPSFLDPLTESGGGSSADFDADEASTEEDAEATPHKPKRVPDPQLKLAACERRWGSWNSRQLAAQGAIRRVELLRIQESSLGIVREQCRVAITTAAGVFVSNEEEPCQGAVGPGRSVNTRLRELSWLTDTPGAAFKVEMEQDLEGLQRFAMVCSVGASGVPSCGSWHSLQCMDEQGAMVELGFVFRNGTVERPPRQGSAHPHLNTYLSCSELEAAQPLVFP